ncbi:unnamed protein product [Cuscuta campestris]|uniref:K Homology domain-containing protein n=1 Tax=Cuscuta campestris TaxID=132261 RepID=A0A484K0V1_9ASTE|nr:unnamed protein product [Cuscuta campestris]
MEAPNVIHKNQCESQVCPFPTTNGLHMSVFESQDCFLPFELTYFRQLERPLKRKRLQEPVVDNTGGSSTKKGWIIFRMMIPAPSDGCIDRYNNVLKQYFEKDNIGVDFYEAGTGIGIVMVSAKEDSWRSKTNAVHVFHAIYDMFLLRMSCLKGRYLIRLLVPAANTKKLIVLQTINSHSCKPVIYLTDNVPFLSSGDVILEVEEDRRHIDEIMLSVYSDLREFRVDESMVSELKATNGIHLSNRVMSARGSGMKLRRNCGVLASKPIPLSYIDLIIGEDGANVENIRKSSPASVYLKPLTLKEVTICIDGESHDEVEAAKNAMEVLLWKTLLFDTCICGYHYRIVFL